jgi:two-component system response regulator AtoC
LSKAVPATESKCQRHVVRAGDSEFITSSPAVISQLDMLDLVAGRDLTVLLIGETGTGKTTLARIIHNKSSRRDQPFLALSCASLSNELIGSELFGHVKGAFTGAERTKIGKFEAVGSGTILLDEIDVLSPMHQANLLRVIETGEFEPVGSNETRVSRARIIAAANVCLRSLSESGQFRSDLYYRLNQVSFDLPPLRERPEDIVPLAVHLIEEVCREENLDVEAVTPDFLNALRAYSWPGNIRELRNAVRRAVLFCTNGSLTEQFLSGNLRRPHVERATLLQEPASQHSRLDSNVARKEAETIKTALEVHQFNRAATARALGISRVTLYNKIRKYQIRIDGPRV